jgi:hypothetical protein
MLQSVFVGSNYEVFRNESLKCASISQTHFLTKIVLMASRDRSFCYDRECCLLYKKDWTNTSASMRPPLSWDTNNDKEDRYKSGAEIVMKKPKFWIISETRVTR